MSRDVTFYGRSDDLFECDGIAADSEEIGCVPDHAGVYVIEAFGQQGMQVIGLYADKCMEGGVWAVGIAPLDEDIPLPDWPIKFTGEGYSTRLTVTIPDDAKIRVSKYYAKQRDDD